MAWRNVTEYDPVGWCAQLMAASGCSKNVVYSRRRQWLAEFQVDLAVPYVFFRDLAVLGPNSFAMPATREALLSALGEGDGDETVRLLRGASDSFFARMSELVGVAVTSPPTPLPLKVARLAGSNASAGANPAPAVAPSARLPLASSAKSPASAGKPHWPGNRPKRKASRALDGSAAAGGIVDREERGVWRDGAVC